jgi:hypothetical protein
MLPRIKTKTHHHHYHRKSNRFPRLRRGLRKTREISMKMRKISMITAIDRRSLTASRKAKSETTKTMKAM